jgi:predicted ArsR family transcriptional regulator
LRQEGKQGITALRRQQLERMAQEALDQGALLTAEDLAFRIFNCGLRTISRDLQALAEEGIVVPLRSQQKDAGRALSHRVQAVELYLKRYTFTQIQKRIYHSLHSIANYVTSFTIVVAHTRDGHSVDEIAFLMQISPSLVRAYQGLYAQYNTPEYQERLNEIVALVKARGFRPEQLVAERGVKKGGQQP